MLKHELLTPAGILVLVPEGALTRADFDLVASALDPYLAEQGALNGLLIEAAHFPGWEDFTALLAHLRFVHDHQQHIRRVALVSDDAVLSHLPSIAGHFVAPEVRRFPANERTLALAWLQASDSND